MLCSGGLRRFWDNSTRLLDLGSGMKKKRSENKYILEPLNVGASIGGQEIYGSIERLFVRFLSSSPSFTQSRPLENSPTDCVRVNHFSAS